MSDVAPWECSRADFSIRLRHTGCMAKHAGPASSGADAQSPRLEDDYAEAWAQWSTDERSSQWDSTLADGTRQRQPDLSVARQEPACGSAEKSGTDYGGGPTDRNSRSDDKAADYEAGKNA